MAISVSCFDISGVDGYRVVVEVNTNFGQPGISIVGMADRTIKEATDRMRAALLFQGYDYPEGRITINLAPSGIKKKGSHFDLAMAIGILIQTDQMKGVSAIHYGFVGELSLNGEIRPVNGILPMIMEAKRIGMDHVIVPSENISEASLVEDIHVFGFSELRPLVRVLEGKEGYERPSLDRGSKSNHLEEKHKDDFKDVKGQKYVVRNAVVAAAGGHNMLMIGEPGCGKSMIAKRISTILPKMSREEQLEVTKIKSVAGVLDQFDKLADQRPFRQPHHNASLNAIIGGGARAIPGEVSLAHNGVLFLDEMNEFNRKTLDAMRQPLEDKSVTISRVNSNNTYPANFMLVAAVNPCPCGFYGSSRCTCTPGQVKKYQQKVSGPIMDRIDIIQKVKPVNVFQLEHEKAGKTSEELRMYVEKARRIQEKRFRNIHGVNCNAQMNSKMIKEYCYLDKHSKAMLRKVFEVYSLSARTYDRILRIARTYADLEGAKDIREKDIKSAIIARGLKTVE